jgi:hypothetical protein
LLIVCPFIEWYSRPPYINERVEANTFALDKPLPKGTYRWQVTAYNGSDVKLAESSNEIKFTLTVDAHN